MKWAKNSSIDQKNSWNEPEIVQMSIKNSSIEPKNSSNEPKIVQMSQKIFHMRKI